jgi:single-strand DNA-binding protein
MKGGDTMSLNRVIEHGRVPFDLELKGEKDKEYLGMSISVKRNYKPEGDQYYPEDLLFCKAFKGQAVFIANHFKKGDDIIVEGELRRDDDYEKDGETVKGQMYINITAVYFAGGKKSNGDDAPADEAPKSTGAKKAAPASKAGTSKAGSTPGLNPLAGGKKKGPFKE